MNIKKPRRKCKNCNKECSKPAKFYCNNIEGIYHTESNTTNNFGYFIQNLEIFIENQPVFKNPIMKSISIAIFTFFIL